MVDRVCRLSFMTYLHGDLPLLLGHFNALSSLSHVFGLESLDEKELRVMVSATSALIRLCYFGFNTFFMQENCKVA